MIIKESFGFIKTDKNRHFTDVLVPRASEYENIQFGSHVSRYSDRDPNTSANNRGEARCWINHITLTTATTVDFAVAFYASRATHQMTAATPYDNALLGWVELNAEDAVNFGNATEYVYATAFQAFAYLDEDGTNELHIGLHNIDASRTKTNFAGKNEGGGASSTGQASPYVTMRIGYIAAG